MNALKAPARFYLLPAATLVVVFACGVGAGLLLGGGGAARASGPSGNPGKEHAWNGWRGGAGALLDELDLTAEQRSRMDALLKQQHAEIHEACNEMRPKIDDIHLRYDPQIRAVLNDAQWQRWQDARGKCRPGGRGKDEGAP
ncbi:MAG TPA: hypothetical protein VGM03_23330 [Phycisphaerae bacterium]|jgi:hypothetical protein